VAATPKYTLERQVIVNLFTSLKHEIYINYIKYSVPYSKHTYYRIKQKKKQAQVVRKIAYTLLCKTHKCIACVKTDSTDQKPSGEVNGSSAR
jgi:hypothetical protein